MVFSQLRIATLGGEAQHIVEAHGATQNGFMAWQDLLKWFDGAQIKADLAEERRNALESLRLHPNTTASAYISKFMLANIKLKEIPGESFTEAHLVSMFLGNIESEEYKVVKDFCNSLGFHL